MHGWFDKTKDKVRTEFHKASGQVTDGVKEVSSHVTHATSSSGGSHGGHKLVPPGLSGHHLLDKAKGKIEKALPSSPRPGAKPLTTTEDAELQTLLQKWNDPERQKGLVPEKDSGRPVWDTTNLGWQDFAKRRCGAFWMGAKAYQRYSKVEDARDKMGEENPEYQAMRDNFHNELAKDIRINTERAKGMYIKFCQELSTKSGIVKDVYIDEFQPLTNSTPESSPEEVMRVMRQDLGRPLDEVFSDFGLRPIASASIGQVHKARLKSTGELVAVKIQHEGVDRVMLEDLKTLRKLAKMMSKLEPNGFDMRPIIQSWEETLPLELDFRQEAHATLKASAALQDTGVVVPPMYEKLCTKRMLIMGFLHMSPFTALLDKEFVKQSGADVRSVCEELVEACGVLVFKAGLLHGDPHAGNVCVIDREDGPGVHPVLLDWGMFYDMTEAERLGMARFYYAMSNVDMPGMLDALTAVGMKFKGGVVKSQDFVENFVSVIKMMSQETQSKQEREADTKARADAAKAARAKSKAKVKAMAKATGMHMKKFMEKSWGEVTKGLSGRDHEEKEEAEEEVVLEDSADLMNPFQDIPSSVVIFLRMIMMLVGLFVTVDVTGLQPLPVLTRHAKEALQAASIGKEPLTKISPADAVASSLRSGKFRLQARLSQRLQKLLADGLIAGAQVVVLNGAEPMCELAVGSLSSVDARPVKTSTKFPLLDLFSGLVALVLLRVLRKKSGPQAKQALEQKVAAWWPAFAGGSSTISISQLLSYCAGVQEQYPNPLGFADIDEYDKMVSHFERMALSPTKESHVAYLLQPFLVRKLAESISGSSLEVAAKAELAALEAEWLAGRGESPDVASICRELPPMKGDMMNMVGEPTSSGKDLNRTQSHVGLIGAVLKNPFAFDPLQANASESSSFRAGAPLGASATGLCKLFASKELWQDLMDLDALASVPMDPTALGWLLAAGASQFTRGGLQVLKLRRKACLGSCFAGVLASTPDDLSQGYGLLSPWGPCVMHFPKLTPGGITVAVTVNDALRGAKASAQIVTDILAELGAAPTWTSLPLRVITDATRVAKSPELAPVIERMGGMSQLMAMAQENLDQASWQQRLALAVATLGKRCASVCGSDSKKANVEESSLASLP